MMTLGKQIKTEQLILRLFTLSDAKDAQRLAGDKEIARNTLVMRYAKSRL